MRVVGKAPTPSLEAQIRASIQSELAAGNEIDFIELTQHEVGDLLKELNEPGKRKLRIRPNELSKFFGAEVRIVRSIRVVGNPNPGRP